MRKKNAVSKALWVPIIWMLLLYSRDVSAWLIPGHSVESESADQWTQGNSLDRNIILILMMIGFFVLVIRKINWSGIILNNGWTIWLYYYCCISLLWSDQPLMSFKRLLKDLTNIIMVLIVLTDSNPIKALKVLIRKCMYILIPLSIVLIKWFPEYGRYWNPFGGEGRNLGVADGKNKLGMLCSIGGLFFFWDLFVMWRNRKISPDQISLLINILFLIMIFYLFILANSQSSIGSFIIGVSILINLTFIREKIKYFGFFIFHIALVAIVIFLTDFISVIFENMGRDSSLTGRTDVWDYVLQIKINPLVGTGYNSFWSGKRLEQIWREMWWHPKQAHNGYLETYLNLGIIGVTSLLAVIISTYKNVKKELITNFEIGKFQMAILFMIIISNWTEASFIYSTPLWFLFLFAIIKIPKPLNVYDL